MDKNCNNCTFRERSYSEYPCDKCRSGSNWTPSGNLIDFAIEELEKIRAKITACTQQEEGEVPACINYGIKLSTEIVEKHIAKLKGE